jgi:hypothetical protein
MVPPRSSCTPQLRRALALGTFLLGLAGLASAQGTDSCATPTVVAGFGSFPVDNSAAAAGNDALPGCASIGRDVWFTWNAPSSGSVTVATCGGLSIDTVLGVYNGNTCPGGASIACSDDACGLQSSATFTAVAGQDYVFQIGAFGTGSGASGTFSISGPPVPPANDECSAASAISGTGLFPFTTVNATTGSQGQAEALCNFFSFTGIARDVWFNWTAPSTGVATVATCAQAAYDTKIAVYGGAGCPTGSALACNDDACALQSSVQFACVAGQVYSIQVGSYPGGGGSSGAGNLNITVGAPTLKLSQLYGAGGNISAPTRQDYIEVYNPGPVAVPLSGWSVQYASSAGTFSALNTTALPAVTLGVGRYLLVQQAAGTSLVAGQVPDLPTPDATGTIAMAADNFKVALVSSTTPLPTGTPTYAGNPTLVDFVGTGTANWNDASANGVAHVAANNAPAGATAYALLRVNCGAGDTNVSRDDWAVAFPTARNTATAANAGLSVVGTALPLTPREGDTVRLTVTPFACSSSAPAYGATVTVDATALGGGPTAMVDNGTAGDEVANDGIYTALVTAGAGTGGATRVLPVTVTSGPNSGGGHLAVFVTLPASPANDNCSTATPLSGPFPIVASGTLAGATAESNPLVTAASAPTNGMSSRRGVWYSVAGTGNTMTAGLCATAPAFDSVLLVFAGTCDGLTVIATGDDNGPACTGTQASAAWCSQLGANYLIWVAPFATGAAAQPLITLTVSDGAPCTTALPATICSGVAGPYTEAEAGYGPHTNDGCSSSPNRFTDIAEPGPTPVVIRGTARGMIGNRDVDYYRFLATASGPIQMTLDTLGSQAQAQLHTLSAGGACPSTLVPGVLTPIFVTRCATGIQTVSGNVTAGQWYAILVVGGVGIQQTPAATVFGGQMPGGTTYQYALSVSIGAPPANDLCANATPLTGTSVAGSTLTATNDGTSSCDATGDDVWYSFTAGADAGTLNLNTCGASIDTVISVYDACGGVELACNDDCGGTPCTGPGSCLSVPVAANASVRIRVSDKGGPGGSFTLNWTFTVPPPANDECATATPISGNGPFAFDNRFATPITPIVDLCGTRDAGRDVWFAWTSQGAGPVTIDTCTGAGSWDSVIAVYTGTCSPLTQIACNDDSCGLMSSLTFNADCTTTYYIRIASWSNGTTVTTGVQGTFNLTAPGFVDTDGDGVNDCLDGCPLDPNKIAPGICGCGVSDVDTDGDGTPDCNDGCPLDPNKIAPGICGCGVSDVDTDGDGTPDCNDGCPLDPNKIAPGICGCGVSDVDTDGDGTPDCNDGCPLDPNKIAPGICGCGVSDVDTDGDGTPDCNDGCPLDPLKTAPGQCGCGIADTDTDGDGTADCNDGCPLDPLKTSPGQCGCGVVDVDTDGDGVADCIDNCPLVANAGQLDQDSDGVGDACDNCVQVANPGQGDCNGDLIGDACEIFFGVPDCNGNGIPDPCDIADLTSGDLNNNTIPDECEVNGGTPFCFGYTACPCGNNSLAGSGQGCVNSTSLGAALTGSGVSSLGSDSLVLSVTNLPVPGSGTGFALFFQGDAQTNLPFQDGRRCVSGAQVRLGVKAHTGGTTSFPQMGDLPVSIEGGVGGPGARYYQVWYRNVTGPCGTGSNVSNGLAVIWAP